MTHIDNERFTRGIGLVILLGTLTAFDPLTIDMYLPAFHDIQTGFATTVDKVELSVSTFFTGMAFGQLVYGPLADRFGRKRPLIGGMLVYLISTLGCAYAPSIETFIGFRLLQALGGCAGMVISRAIIRDLFETRQVAVFLSNMALVMGIAPITAPTIGAIINDHFGWRAIFFFLAISNFICMIAISVLLPETHKIRARGTRISTVLLNYFRLLKHREFVGYLIPDTAIRAGMFAYIAGSPFVYIQLLGIPANRYGLVFGMNALGLVTASQVNRRLLKFWSPNVILRWSVKIAALTSVGVFLSGWFGPSRFIFLSAVFVFLATLNFISPNSIAGALSSQGHQAGTASALYGCLQWTMASLSSFLVSYFHSGTAVPMSSVILFCGVLSFTAFHLLVRPIDRNWNKAALARRSMT